MPTTLGDRIAAKKLADSKLKPAQDAVSTAGSAYATAMADVEAANATLKIDLVASGPVYLSDTNGIEVWLPDSSGAGFHFFRPADAASIPASDSAPAPVEPTPTPAPAPVEPTPAAGPTPAPAEAAWNEVPKPETPKP